ncbi:hypothetical protein [Nonlabens sp. Asnod3-A02]|uniref:hypothetical protein n=1 Tax=Nonlabens sp. Asnod3-A02 TaxID=3160579 RepID=UPI00387070F5
MKIKRQSINSSLGYLTIIPLIAIILFIVNKKENTSIKYDVCHNLKKKIFTLDKSIYITPNSVFNDVDLNFLKENLNLNLNDCGGDLIKYSSDIKHLKKLKLIYNTPKLCPGIHYRSYFTITLRDKLPFVENDFIQISSIGDSLSNYLLEEEKYSKVVFDFKKNDNSKKVSDILDEIIRGYSIAYDSLSFRKFKRSFCQINEKEIEDLKLDFKLIIPTKEGISGRPPAPAPPPPSLNKINVIKNP